jgi:hypothetical protein
MAGMQRALMAVALWLLPIAVCAQWLSFRTPGIPRTPDGKPNLTAPAPPMRDGKPDLSGLWRLGPNFYWLDLIQDVKDETIFKPAAAALFRKRADEYNLDGPYTRCLPLGPGDIFVSAFRIIQSPTVVALLYNAPAGDSHRQVFLDGRELPKDPNPTWRGYSVGHWEGETLMVETVGFNDGGWLDQVGHPRSESLRVTERFRRIDFGHMQFQITFSDPEILAQPLTISLPVNYMPDTEMLETVCNENERDRAHFTGKLNDGVKLSAGALVKYVGTYGSVVVTLVDDRLYLLDIPLFPQSETKFDSRLAPVEFSLDADGAVTSLTLIGALGDEARLDRKR